MNRNLRRAFTLLEILVSATLLCGLLTVGVMLAVQLEGFWSTQADDSVFERHVAGLNHYLRSYRHAEVMPEKLKNISGDVVPFVTIRPDPGSPLMTSRLIPAGPVVAALEFKRDVGLGVVWLSDSGNGVGMGAPERVLLSPWVTAATVSRYDIINDNWESSDVAHSPVSSKRWTVLHVTVAHRGQRSELWIPWNEPGEISPGGGKL